MASDLSSRIYPNPRYHLFFLFIFGAAFYAGSSDCSPMNTLPIQNAEMINHFQYVGLAAFACTGYAIDLKVKKFISAL